MKSKNDELAAAVASQQEVVDRLDELMTCPTDRAYIICTYRDCINNVKGECTIFTILDPLLHGTDSPCSSYARSV